MAALILFKFQNEKTFNELSSSRTQQAVQSTQVIVKLSHSCLLASRIGAHLLKKLSQCGHPKLLDTACFLVFSF